MCYYSLIFYVFLAFFGLSPNRERILHTQIDLIFDKNRMKFFSRVHLCICMQFVLSRKNLNVICILIMIKRPVVDGYIANRYSDRFFVFVAKRKRCYESNWRNEQNAFKQILIAYCSIGIDRQSLILLHVEKKRVSKTKE